MRNGHMKKTVACEKKMSWWLKSVQNLNISDINMKTQNHDHSRAKSLFDIKLYDHPDKIFSELNSFSAFEAQFYLLQKNGCKLFHNFYFAILAKFIIFKIGIIFKFSNNWKKYSFIYKYTEK